MYLYVFLVRLLHLVNHFMPAVVAGPLKNVLKLLVALGLRALTAFSVVFRDMSLFST